MAEAFPSALPPLLLPPPLHERCLEEKMLESHPTPKKGEAPFSRRADGGVAPSSLLVFVVFVAVVAVFVVTSIGDAVAAAAGLLGAMIPPFQARKLR